jgi:hypothetical protein
MANQYQIQFRHDNNTRREFENVYKLLRILSKGLLLHISEAEPLDKFAGLRWFKPSEDVLKEWTGDGWKQLYPGVFA